MFDFNSDEQIAEETEKREQFIQAIKEAYERGEDVSKYVWPSDWELRERPEPHHASSVISLIDAIDLCGQHLYGNNWKQDNWYARSPEEIEAWDIGKNLYRAIYSINKEKAVDYSSSLETETQAYTRKHFIFSKLSALLNQETVEAFTLDINGKKTHIPNNIWLSKQAVKMLNNGKQPKENWATKAEFIYLDGVQLETALEKELPARTHNEINQIKSHDEEIESNLSLSNSNQEMAYTPDYLKLMLRAVQELNLSADKRADMNGIKDWLNHNWPERLEGKSQNLIASMATLLRRPEDKKGGNTSWKDPKGGKQ